MSRKKRRRKGSRPVPAPTPEPTTTRILRKVGDHPYQTAALSAGIFLLATYSVSLFSPTLIVHEDSILRLPVVSHAGNVPRIFSRDFMLFSSGQFRPLSYALIALVRTFVAAENILFWHLWLLAFHAVNTLLVFAIARHFTRRLAVALTAGAVFGLHPLCTVIVNDINQFYMLLGVTLSLGSLKAYLFFSRNGSKPLYALAVVLFLLALLTARPAVFLGLVVLLYELLYQRSGLKRSLLRVSLFALIPLSLLPLWLWHTPHPVHYKYVAMYKGSFWHGLFSVTAATKHYAGGLVLTRGIPSILHEIVEKIYRWNHPRFVLWAAVNLVLVVGAVVALARKGWAALGILLIFIGMVPYASVAYNRVADYVSWSYLYLPVAGLALFAAGLHRLVLQARSRYLKVGCQVAFLTVFLFLGARSVQLNLSARSPLAYWSHVWQLNKESQTAQCEVGKAYLARDQLPQALRHFFAPTVKELKYPCLAMARYYCREGNPLASAIHLRFGMIETATGLILEDYCAATGELLLQTRALDHAEENFGKILMVNPFNTAAMTRLARVWLLKGFIREARRMAERARDLAPDDKDVARVGKEIRETERAWRDNPQPLTITPPRPDWLRYVLTEMRPPALRKKIVALSDRAGANDPVIQLEAMISLIEDKEYTAAARKALAVLRRLSGSAYACAGACQAFAYAGSVEEATELGLRAVSLDATSELAWRSLGLALALEDKPGATARKFTEAVAGQPAAAYTFYYNLGLQKKRIGKRQEAADLFEKALEAMPDDVKALQALGEARLSLGQFEAAAEVLRRAVARKPSDAEAHANLGWAFLNQRKHAEAVGVLRTAVELDPGNALYHNDLAACLAMLDRSAEAIQEFRRAIGLDSTLWDAHYNLANCLVKEGKLSDAVGEFREAIKLMPAQRYLHSDLAATLRRLGHIDEAISEYRKEIQYNPRFPDAYTALVSLYCEKAGYAEAWKIVELADRLGVQVDPDTLATLREASSGREE